MRGGESQDLEFKESLKLKDEIGETVSAFSNSDGGVVLVGVSDSSSELRKLAKESGGRVYWNEQICKEASLEDIDEEKVRWFLKEARKQRGLKISEDAPAEEALMKLKLLRNGELTNAAILLFFKELTFLQSEVKCIRFSGNEPVKPYIDFQTLEGTVFDRVEGAEDFVLSKLKQESDLGKGPGKREEKEKKRKKKKRETATRDLGGIVKEGIFDKISEGKRNLRYVLIQNAAKMRQKITQKGASPF
ncbi:MAG TPA: hypothetical protein C5S37_01285 [Methanophagales archaeon]|nr:hypothetical protein [Methanophagales archaeon]